MPPPQAPASPLPPLEPAVSRVRFKEASSLRHRDLPPPLDEEDEAADEDAAAADDGLDTSRSGCCRPLPEIVAM